MMTIPEIKMAFYDYQDASDYELYGNLEYNGATPEDVEKAISKNAAREYENWIYENIK